MLLKTWRRNVQINAVKWLPMEIWMTTWGAIAQSDHSHVCFNAEQWWAQQIEPSIIIRTTSEKSRSYLNWTRLTRPRRKRFVSWRSRTWFWSRRSWAKRRLFNPSKSTLEDHNNFRKCTNQVHTFRWKKRRCPISRSPPRNRRSRRFSIKARNHPSPARKIPPRNGLGLHKKQRTNSPVRRANPRQKIY